MPFKKGQSGNKGGRPLKTEEEKREREQFKRLLKSSTVDALRSIIEIANDKDSKDRLSACKYIIDKAYGLNTAFLEEESASEVNIRIVPYLTDKEGIW